jgi:prepilin-type N-terminal cleavage/methylation domain-containing protein
MRRGFTLLEALVATALMAVAVTGVLTALSTSLRNAARLGDYDRGSLLARRKMTELMTEARLPRNVPLQGGFDRVVAAGLDDAGWRAVIRPFEHPPGAGPGTRILDRIELEVWWVARGQRRSFTLEAYRPGVLLPQDGVLP